MKENRFKINIKIDGKSYELTIDREDEERYRKAAKLVNETLIGYRQRFQTDEKDIMAMTAFQQALNYCNEQERQNYSQFVDEVKEMKDDISDFLKERKQK